MKKTNQTKRTIPTEVVDSRLDASAYKNTTTNQVFIIYEDASYITGWGNKKIERLYYQEHGTKITFKGDVQLYKIDGRRTDTLRAFPFQELEAIILDDIKKAANKLKVNHLYYSMISVYRLVCTDMEERLAKLWALDELYGVDPNLREEESDDWDEEYEDEDEDDLTPEQSDREASIERAKELDRRFLEISKKPSHEQTEEDVDFLIDYLPL